MDKVNKAVMGIAKIISDNRTLLDGRYEKIEYTSGARYIHLKCYKTDNQWRFLSIGEDFLGSKPKLYTGLEYQKRGGHKKQSEDLENYHSKEKRIQETDGLIIEFKFHAEGKTGEIGPPIYQYDSNVFLDRFKSHFLQ